MIVLDASAVLELLLATERGAQVARRIAPIHESLHAPHLIDLEVAQVLRRAVARGQLEPPRAEQALADLRDLDLARYAHDLFLDRIWQLRENATACDAAYLALAETLDAPLLTSDERLCDVPSSSALIELVARP